MAVRNIVKFDLEKCVGCGNCVKACRKNAIEIVNSKASLISESLCDGLGVCIPSCPVGAISIERKDAPDFRQKI
jgi:MinD superfamily P-loop ATPase